MRMSLEQAPPPLHRRDVPPHLETLLWQLLDKDPARRPGDARQVYDQLLPFVAPPGPLGDIDPRAWSRTGMQLYARLLSRLSGADPGSAYPSSPYASGPYPSGPHGNGPTTPGTRHDMQAPNTRGDAGWTVRHSLWLLPTLLLGGLGAWLSFAYIALRHQRLPWLGAAVAYLALSTVAFTLAAVGPDPATGALGVVNDIGACLLLALWPATIIHALWVNFKSRKLPLLRASPASAASAAAASAAA